MLGVGGVRTSWYPEDMCQLYAVVRLPKPGDVDLQSLFCGATLICDHVENRFENHISLDRWPCSRFLFHKVLEGENGVEAYDQGVNLA